MVSAACASAAGLAVKHGAARGRSPAPVVRPGTASKILADVRSPGARATLVNVWATWCGPCRTEFPDLVRFARDARARGVRVVFVSADFPDQLPRVKAFLARQGVTDPSWIKSGDDQAFINALAPRWSGALPATFVYDSTGTQVRFWEGAADSSRFEAEVGAVLDGGR
jgi:thiol-disulfide isomerase/thioredoxin